MTLHRVELRGIPVDLHQRAMANGDELRREFMLLAADRDAHDVPARLLALADELSVRYGGVGDPARDAVLDAASRGHPTADAVCEVPADIVEACELLRTMLDEADEYCRRGDRLLTLAPSEELVAYRHWFLDQFIDQIAGRPPRSWAEVAPTAPGAQEPAPPADEPRAETVVPLSGVIDLETAPELRATLAEVRERKATAIVVDLAEVTFIDSVGLSVLVSVHRRLRDEGGRLTVRRPREEVRQVLAMAGLCDVLDVRA